MLNIYVVYVYEREKKKSNPKITLTIFHHLSLTFPPAFP